MNLKPIGANQNQLTLNNGTEILFSYKTPVAAINKESGIGVVYVTVHKWSKTTSKHITQWLNSKGRNRIAERPQAFFDDLIK